MGSKHLAGLCEKTNQVLELYKKLDDQIQRIRCNLPSCPYGCRDCCTVASKNIEATILEFFPLALNWYSEGILDEKYEKLKNITQDEPCALLESDPSILPHGGCTVYEYRPLVCRIFGSSSLIRKNRIDFLACKKLKVQNVNPAVLPLASDLHDELVAIDPYLAAKKYPINEALKKAVEYVLNYDYFLRFLKDA